MNKIDIFEKAVNLLNDRKNVNISVLSIEETEFGVIRTQVKNNNTGEIYKLSFNQS